MLINGGWLRSKDRARWIMRTCGITHEDQGNRCRICSVEHKDYMCGTSKISRLHIDHCHTTGKIRGLPCLNCNSALGSFRDSRELLLKAIKYLDDNDE